jgi:predicted hydrocarbon binding protein
VSNDVIENLQDLPEGGALLYEGSRYLLLPAEALADFQRAVEMELGGEKVGQAIYRCACLQGKMLTDYFRPQMSLHVDEFVRFMTLFVRQLGWGRTEIINLSVGHNLMELEVYHSAFAEGYRKAGDPVCHWLRGLYAGVLQALCGAEVVGLETRCRAVEGPGPCSFIFAAAPDQNRLNVFSASSSETDPQGNV